METKPEQENLDSEQKVSDEVKDESADLAGAALESTEDKETDTKPDPKDAVIGEYRRKARDAELETARLRGQIEATQTQVKPTEKSPIELAAEQQEVSVDDVEISGALYKKQRAWEKKQDAAETEQAAAKDRTALGQRSFQTASVEFSTAKVGVGLDLKTVIEMGEQYLTPGDKLDISRAKDPMKLAYQRCKRAILDSGTEEATLLQQRIDAHKSKAKDKGDPDKAKAKAEAEAKAKAEAEAKAEAGASPEPSIHKTLLQGLFHAND